MKDLEDHGLPLVQLKEQRRELVVALAGRNGPISDFEISEIASLQQAIAAMEAVVDDLDSKIQLPQPQRKVGPVFGTAGGRPSKHMELIFGRRSQSGRDHHLRTIGAG
jgi:hypothetical protein